MAPGRSSAAHARYARAAPLSDASRWSQAFGADLSGVRVHTESARARELGALAFASGDDVHVAPGSEPTGELLGHELTHVVQQRAGLVDAPQPAGVSTDAALERQADELGARAARGERVAEELPGATDSRATGATSSRTTGATAIQRQCPDDMEEQDGACVWPEVGAGLGEAEIHDPLAMSIEELRAFGYSDQEIAAIREERGGQLCDTPEMAGRVSMPDAVAAVLESAYTLVPTASGYRLQVDPHLAAALAGLTFERVRLALVVALLSDLLADEIDPFSVASCVDVAGRVRSNVPTAYDEYAMQEIQNEGHLWVEVPHALVQDAALALGTTVDGVQTERQHLWAVALEHVIGRAVEEAPADDGMRERLRDAWNDPARRAQMVRTLVSGGGSRTIEQMRYQFDTTYELFTGARLPAEQDLHFYDWSFWGARLPMLLVQAEIGRDTELARSHRFEGRQRRYDRRRAHPIETGDTARYVFRALHDNAGQTYATSDLLAGQLAVGDRVTLTGGREVVIIDLPGDVRYFCEDEGVVYRQGMNGFCDELLFGTIGMACQDAAAIAALAEGMVDVTLLLIQPLRGPFLIAQLAGTALYIGEHWDEIAAAWRYFGEVKGWFDANAPEVLEAIIAVAGVELVRSLTVEFDPDFERWAEVALRALGDAALVRGRGPASGLMARLQPVLDRGRRTALRLHTAMAALDTLVGVEVSIADVRRILEDQGITEQTEELADALRPHLDDPAFQDALLLLSNTLGGLIDTLGGL